MAYRLATIVGNHSELIERLSRYCHEGGSPEDTGMDIYVGEVSPLAASANTRNDIISTFSTQADFWVKVGRDWVQGAPIDWRKIQSDITSLVSGPSGYNGARRIPIPDYPFARNRYWLQKIIAEPTAISSLANDTNTNTEKDTRKKKETSKVPVMPLCAVWNRVTLDCQDLGFESQNVLIMGGSEEELEPIRQRHPLIKTMDLFHASDDMDAMEKQFAQFGDLEHIVWIASEPASGEVGQQIIENQYQGVIQVFRLVKALARLGYGDRALKLTFVTRGSCQVNYQEYSYVDHASLHGFVGVLAKEYGNWKIRLLDLDASKNTPDPVMNSHPGYRGNGKENSLSQWPIDQIFELPFDRQGEALAYRDGQWFKQSLIKNMEYQQTRNVFGYESTYESAYESPYRHQGVYVVIGGAGGLGELWSRYVCTQFNARVVWVGRRPLDEEISKKLDLFTRIGAIRPIYLQADATDPESLSDAHTAIKEHYKTIDGMVHSAVGEFDHSIEEMDESRFRRILSVKLDASINLWQTFGADDLDFMLFFSSITAFEKNGGMSGYVAGCNIQDAMVNQLVRRTGKVLKTINWGHWGVGTGNSISQASKIRVEQSGTVLIEELEGMRALEQQLSGSNSQVALIKTRRPESLSLFSSAEKMLQYDHHHPGLLPSISEAIDKNSMGEETIRNLHRSAVFQFDDLAKLLLSMLYRNLLSMGVIRLTDGKVIAKDGHHKECSGFYERWLTSSVDLLNAHQEDIQKDCSLAELWKQWEDQRADWLSGGDILSGIRLVEACLRQLPEILTGEVRATDIMFPDSSMAMVEGVYSGNRVSDLFNEGLGNTLVQGISAQLLNQPKTRIRILEIGAGTGGTTKSILPMLHAHQGVIEEYCYTDISKAFLFHGEELFSKYPYFTTHLLDIEKPLDGQGIDPGGYDFVIATNVLHATQDIKRTLRHVKAILRKNGLLLINELCDVSVFAHLTFGLLEGWWLSKDSALRIPNSPMLYPNIWETVLHSEGFPDVLFTMPAARSLGQQIILAESDGIVRYPHSTTSSINAPLEKLDTGHDPETRKSQSVANGDGDVERKTTEYLKTLMAETLKMEVDDINDTTPLEHYGIDSILIVQMTNRLKEDFSEISSTLFFEVQSIRELVRYFINTDREALVSFFDLAAQPQTELKTEGTGSAAEVGVEVSGSTNVGNGQDDRIAIIGMSGRYPMAENLDEYWEILSQGKDCVTEIPEERWSLEGFYEPDPVKAISEGKSYSKWMASLEGEKEFDSMFFNISPREALTMDPQERLFLQSAWHALEDAGITRLQLKEHYARNVGVFAGITRTGFDLFGPELWKQGKTDYPHTYFASVANRLSYFLDICGPSMPIDTMCSSSLTAVHEACEKLNGNACELAIVGGVNVYLHSSSYVGLSAMSMLSKDGKCKSFGADANGFVPGEGVGTLILKPLSRAERDGDNIHGIIRASHVNHGGKTNGYTVPNPHAQQALVEKTLEKANLDPRAISYIEAHGTGTELGDPIEITALSRAFSSAEANRANPNNPTTGYCAIGSVKSNLGHLEAAAGIVGLSKVVLQMKHRQLVPGLHADVLNENIKFEQTPFKVQTRSSVWHKPELHINGELETFPRMAGISSFGAGGANAHVILEEYENQEEFGLPKESKNSGEIRDSSPTIIVLSARDSERLSECRGRLKAFLIKQIAANSAPDIRNIGYTLQVGRELMNSRWATTANSLDELVQKLDVSGKEEQVEGIHWGNVNRKEIEKLGQDENLSDQINDWIRQGDYEELLTFWVRGGDVDWLKMHDASTLRRISLPGYPFLRQRIWWDMFAACSEQRDVSSLTAMPRVDSDSVPVDRNNLNSVSDTPASEGGAMKSGKIQLKALSVQRWTQSPSDNAEVPEVEQKRGVVNGVKLKPIGIFKPSLLPTKPDVTMSVPPRRVGGVAPGVVNRFADGALSILINAEDFPNTATMCHQVIKEIGAAVSQDEIKAIILESGENALGFSRESLSDPDLERQLVHSVGNCPIPVISVFRGRVGVPGWLLAVASDFFFHTVADSWPDSASAESITTSDFVLSAEEKNLFRLRFENLPNQLFHSSQQKVGFEKVDLGFGSNEIEMLTCSEDEALEQSEALIRELVRHSKGTLVELKRQLSQHMRAGIFALYGTRKESSVDDVIKMMLSSLDAGARQSPSVVLKDSEQQGLSVEDGHLLSVGSQSVEATEFDNGVVLIKLQERVQKNMFSDSLSEGLKSVFGYINQQASHKVVVLTGYDQYFACGGTLDGLLDIQSGKMRFTDNKIHCLPLECDIPVIAAMQGHGIGGGWSMGMFCDYVIFSEESVYQSPYMNYGFTPGAGSTMIFPFRFGFELAREILMSAREYKGIEFRGRDNGIVVLPRSDVLSHALKTASQMAKLDRKRLIEEKSVRSAFLRSYLDQTHDQELAMHDKTFVGNKEVIDRIAANFNQVGNSPVEVSQEVDAPSSVPLEHQVLLTLRETIAEELYIPFESVHEDAGFVDMGMDSIIAVTWIRKVNERLGLSLEATKVYAYPSISQFAQFIIDESPQKEQRRTGLKIADVGQAGLDESGVMESGVSTLKQKPNVTLSSLEAAGSRVVNTAKQEPDRQSSFDDVLSILAHTIAEELFLPVESIHEDVNFTDLGMDSIIAVTWMKTINQRFGLSMEATRIYAYPTLLALSEYIQQAIPRKPLVPQKRTVGREESSRQAASKLVLKSIHQPTHPIEKTVPELPGSQSSMPPTVPMDKDSGEPGAELTDLVEVLDVLKQTIAAELFLSPEQVDEGENFIDMGMDSIIAVTWMKVVNQRFSLSIEATQIYAYPTLQEFASYIQQHFSAGIQHDNSYGNASGYEGTSRKDADIPEDDVEDVRVSLSSSNMKSRSYSSNRNSANGGWELHHGESRDENAIAIVGMAGKFPKARNLEQFWENIAAGKDCVSEIPSDRWELSKYYDEDGKQPGKTNNKWMGVLENIDHFDPLFFSISPRDAELMDPQQRLFLQTAWACIEDGGYSPKTMSGVRCGVFVGCDRGDYSNAVQNLELSAEGLMGNVVSMLPARIAYFLNLQGPCMVVDTACSSSLVAISNACDSLLLGQSDVALAGGVCIMTGPEIHIMMSKAGMLSPTGHCYTFDQRADGFVPGEGVGAIMLKRLVDAVDDRDQIYGVIRGWGINQDGKTNGITAPNPISQAKLEKEVYEKSGINPENIQLIEAHGTGTKLGDPIEVEGLCNAFSHFTQKEGFCALGSIKTNIGHLATAAGISGVIKLGLSLKHKQLPPSIHHESLNEHIHLGNTPFYVNTQLSDWTVKEGQTRTAGISSFGFSGTNAHMVIEEYDENYRKPTAHEFSEGGNPSYLIVVSARNRPGMERQVRELLDYVDREIHGKGILDGAVRNQHLANLAYTLQMGRDAMTERMAFVTENAAGLSAGLRKFLADNSISDESGDRTVYGMDEGPEIHWGKAEPSRLVQGRLKKDVLNFSTVEQWLENLVNESSYNELLAAWVEGLEVDWELLYRHQPSDHRPYRISLPTYPFEQQRYWVDTPETVTGTQLANSVQTATSSGYSPQITGSKEGVQTDQGSQEAYWAAQKMIWHSLPIAESVDWLGALAAYADSTVAVVSEKKEEFDGFSSLVENLAKAAGLVGRLHIAPISMERTTIAEKVTILMRAKTVFVLVSASVDEKSAIATIQQLGQQLIQVSPLEPKEIFILRETDFSIHLPHVYGLAGLLESAMNELPQHCWRMVHVNNGDTVSKYQRLMQEWLVVQADDGRQQFTQVRYDRENREINYGLEVVNGGLTTGSAIEADQYFSNTLVVTGTVGDLAESFLVTIADKYKPSIVVLGHQKSPWMSRAESMGADLHYYAEHLNDMESVTSVVTDIHARHADIGCVLHFAAEAPLLDTFCSQNLSQFEFVMTEILLIENLTRALTLDQGSPPKQFLFSFDRLYPPGAGARRYGVCARLGYAEGRDNNDNYFAINIVPDEGIRSGESYRFLKCWKQRPLAADLMGHLKDNVSNEILILVNRDSLKLAKSLFSSEDSGCIFVGNGDQSQGEWHYAISENDPKISVATALQLVDVIEKTRLIVDLGDLYDESKTSDADKSGKIAFYQSLIKTNAEFDVIYITKGLIALGNQEMSLAGAKFAGLIRMLSSEYPLIGSRAIDIDNQMYGDPRALEKMILLELSSSLEETEICYRSDTRYMPYIDIRSNANCRSDLDQAPTISASFKADSEGVYVVSGGTNGIGLELAAHLVRRGARKLVLMGMNTLAAENRWEELADSESLSIQERERFERLLGIREQTEWMKIYSGPLTDVAKLHSFFSEIRQHCGAIRGVIHSAGIGPDLSIPAFVKKDLDHTARMFAPKVKGLEHLATVFESDALDFFLCGSSLTSMIPGFARGSSDYSMANAFIDYFAAYHYHQKNQQAFKAVTWIDWSETGIATRVPKTVLETLNHHLGAIGVYAYSDKEGCAFFDQALSQKDASWTLNSYLNKVTFESVSTNLLKATLDLPGRPTEPTTEEMGSKLVAAVENSLSGGFRAVSLSASLPEENSSGVNLPKERSRKKPVTRKLPDTGNANGKDDVKPAHIELRTESLIESQITKWEERSGSGYSLQALELAEFITMDEIMRLDAGLIHRIYALLPKEHSGFEAGEKEHGGQRQDDIRQSGSKTEENDVDIREAVIESFAEVLKLQEIDDNQSFQDYGLDSISAMQLATRLERKLDREIPPQWLIDYPTVSTLAEHLLND
ncbi:MAG: SDR family NAD(P)-dependent oxidoreductase [Gammaproteobacteria bacterium]|nr:SDR family NAD(P)-dependent oxidoreductase [Gammaproteobacteria bacterium]